MVVAMVGGWWWWIVVVVVGSGGGGWGVGPSRPASPRSLTARAKLLAAHVEGAVGAVADEHGLAACADEDLAEGEEG